MSRSLSTAENQVLDQVRNKVQAIVNTGDLIRLTATGLLGNPAANQQAYADFHQVFQQLPTQLQQLRNAGRVQVNPDLDASMGANTPTMVQNGAPVASMELTEDFVSANSETTVTERAITLTHELSHTVFQAPDFIVKDFAYRKSWGQGYLTAAIGWRNADTYAAAAAQIADGLDNEPGRNAEGGRIPALRRKLSELQPGLILGPALAWADMKINRAWLRSTDYESFALSSVARVIWSSTLTAWQADPNTARLLAIEADLRDNKGRIIGDRYGAFTVGLSEDSVRTAKNIHSYMTSLKGALGKIKPTLTDAGQVISYTPGPVLGVLEVPRPLVTGSSSAVGELIVNALVTSLSYTDTADRSTANLTTHKRAIVDLLASNDRPYEAQHVQAMLQRFQGIQGAAAPTQAEWGSARIDVDLATVKGIAERMQRTSYAAAQAAATPGPMRQHLTTLHTSLQDDVDDAQQIGNRYAAQNAPALSAAQAQARKANFTALVNAVSDIQQAAATFDHTLVPAYNNLIGQLAPFTV